MFYYYDYNPNNKIDVMSYRRQLNIPNELVPKAFIGLYINELDTETKIELIDIHPHEYIKSINAYYLKTEIDTDVIVIYSVFD